MDAALRKIGIEYEDVQRCPPITSILKETIGSVQKAVIAMRLSYEPCVRKFLVAYDKVADQKYLPMEAIALLAEVSPAELLGATLQAFKALQAQKSAFMVMDAHPTILKKRIQFAKTKHGVRDRDAIDQSVGFLPTPRGMTMNLTLGNPEKPRSESPATLGEPDVVDVFRPMNEDLEEWQGNRTNLLKDKN